jgi:uncharacterized damage-inducible protein DinB
MTKSSSESVADSLYTDLETELATTRRMLERFPAGKGDWRPHEKSMTLGSLASHVAEIPQYGITILASDELDFAKGPHERNTYGTAEELLAVFDNKVSQLRPALASLNAGTVGTPWTMRNGEYVIFTQPKGAAIRRVMLNHLVHHRAQLGVYYRLLGIPVPGSYGPSADEPM